MSAQAVNGSPTTKPPPANDMFLRKLRREVLIPLVWIALSVEQEVVIIKPLAVLN
jgi:hypothetical protein